VAERIAVIAGDGIGPEVIAEASAAHSARGKRARLSCGGT
jgi:isocitrate/isopropylmalate dehydrogenase